MPHMQSFGKILSAAMNTFRLPLSTDKIGDLADLTLMMLCQANKDLNKRIQGGALSSSREKRVSLYAESAATGFQELYEEYIRLTS